MDVTAHPPSEVLAAFGYDGSAVRLPGGQGRSWQAGDIVLKPAEHPSGAAWVADVMSGLTDTDELRLPTPVRAADGSWVAHGWEAWYVLPGVPDTRRWDDALRAGQAFHAMLADRPRPAFLDSRDDPWSYGDALAWQEVPLRGDEVMAELLEPLAAVRRTVHEPAQPVHGDLLGNVLFCDGLPPAVIDWPVYHRPASWALAVAVVDALTWYGASPALVDRWAHQAEWDQMLIRALMYRIATNEGFRREGSRIREQARDYRPVVDLVLTRAA